MLARFPIRVLSTKATYKACKRLGIPNRRSRQPFQAKGVTPDRVMAARRDSTANRYLHAVDGRDAEMAAALSALAAHGDAAKLPRSIVAKH
jgi:hypothetical protein